MLWNSPVSEEKFGQIVDALALSPHQSVLDVGCGTGEMLIRLVERYSAIAVGIDSSAESIEEAQRRSDSRLAGSSPRWIVADASVWKPRGEAFDLACCIGSTHAFGLGSTAFQQALRNLCPLVRGGGALLIGEGYLRKPAVAKYREVLGQFPPDEMTHEQNIAVAESFGLKLEASWCSSREEWDEFESSHQRKAERDVADNPGDQQACEKLERRRRWMAAYETYGRDTLGFGVYLLRKPTGAESS